MTFKLQLRLLEQPLLVVTTLPYMMVIKVQETYSSQLVEQAASTLKTKAERMEESVDLAVTTTKAKAHNSTLETLVELILPI